MNFERFKKIRRDYALFLPKMMVEYEATGRMHFDPYKVNCTQYFTPIEDSVWCDIRGFGVPFFPQVPVLNFFLDFGCPFLKIGIECDGKKWHNKEKDAARDKLLAAEGWSIFRLEGHECRRLLPVPYDPDSELTENGLVDWFMITSEGLIYSINQMYFVDRQEQFAIDNIHLIQRTIEKHNTTPEVHICKGIFR